AESVYSFFQEADNRALVRALHEAGVHPKTADRGPRSDKLAGKIFVFTGTLTLFKREDAEEMVKRAGGRASGSVSRNTSYVVAGESAGSKLAKAQDLGVP